MPIIIVVEPHPLLRLGILQLLSDVAPSVKLEGADYAHLSNESAEAGHCDLLLLSVPSLEDIYELSAAADRVYSPKAMLLLSENSEMPNSAKGLPASVAGYVPKDVSHEVLQASVRLVLAGGTCFPLRSNSVPAHTPKSLLPVYEPVKWPPAAELANKMAPEANSECQMLGLTPRQYEVLVLLARGYPMKTVGRYLNISVATAKAHTETLYQRLDVHNRNAAVYAAVSRGATLGWASISGAHNSDADTPKPNADGQPGISLRTNGLFRQGASAGS
ncbi:response regulator transcription factor [Pollutimonas bauzanensis]|jgi:DNA-binding NarL/FixJ family response regulator|uniref:response regulator transcription factor n=1 Tax=Pollutimonas bauzanensis TaxID=658167 RepID=UPI0033423785